MCLGRAIRRSEIDARSPNAVPAWTARIGWRLEGPRALLTPRMLCHHRGNGFDDDGSQSRGRPGDDVVGRRLLEWLFGARHDRNTRSDRGTARGGLAPHHRDDVGGRTDEDQAGVLTRPGEARILGQEAVPGMDRVRAGPPRGVDDRVDPQVASCRFAGSDVQRLVRLAHVARAAIAVGVHGHCSKAHLAARAHDSNSDLAAVGDQNFHEAAGPEEGANWLSDCTLQWDVAVLLRRVPVPLRGKCRERRDEARARLARPDDGVDESA